ncbi:MAG: hypothetical protein IPG31_00455 [Nitrosomonas sp.]|nr:hypothetical protein [Nitrosomonas sp.]
MNAVKIKLVISSESNTELFEEINRLPPRNRAERIRTLATIGLLKFSNDPNSQPEDQIQTKEKEDESEDELIRRKKHAMMVAKKLINNL